MVASIIECTLSHIGVSRGECSLTVPACVLRPTCLPLSTVFLLYFTHTCYNRQLNDLFNGRMCGFLTCCAMLFVVSFSWLRSASMLLPVQARAAFASTDVCLSEYADCGLAVLNFWTCMAPLFHPLRIPFFFLPTQLPVIWYRIWHNLFPHEVVHWFVQIIFARSVCLLVDVYFSVACSVALTRWNICSNNKIMPSVGMLIR